MKRVTILFGLLFFVCVGSTAWADTNVGASLRVWLAELSAEGESIDKDTALASSSIDFEDDLDMDTSEVTAELAVSLKFGNQAVHFSYAAIGFDGSETLTANFNYEDETFTAGTTVDSEFDLTWFSGAWEYRWAMDPGPVNWEIGILAGLSVLTMSTTIEDTGSAQEASSDSTAPYPKLGGHVHAGFLDSFYADVLLFVFSADTGDLKVSATELTIELGYQYEWFTTGLGVRHLGMSADGEDGSSEIEADVSLTGIYFHFGVAF